MSNKVTKMISDTLGVLTGVGLFIAILLIGPLVALASINTLAAHSTADFYIPHNIWTYLSVYGILLVVNAK